MFERDSKLGTYSQVPKVHSPKLPEEKCIGEVVRIGSIIIFYRMNLLTALSPSLSFPALCRPGHFSDNGLDESGAPCEPCAKDTYQAYEGQQTCNVCPPGSRTLSGGATSIDDCVSKSFFREGGEREVGGVEGGVGGWGNGA